MNNLQSRRAFVKASTGIAVSVLVQPSTVLAQSDSLAAVVREYAGAAAVREGRVKLDIAALVDNGNSVPIEVTVESPMTDADHVVGIAIFNEKNPERDVAQFTLGPLAGRAHVTTRIRLASTQKLVAVAKMSDGSCWSHTVNVVVTLAACIEE
ncbi:MAG: SoxY-related AACIE arm protein [Betaproteobacteria bacterium]